MGSTTAIGNKLESKILEILRSEIAAGRFFIKDDCCKIFPKKGYYSKDREKDIVFDIAIEVYMPESSSYSMLILVECKNYTHPVPVDDVEEFVAKIQQVSGANVKGIIASASSFQEGALKYAKSKGIGVLRYFDKRNFKWILHRSASTLGLSTGSSAEWIEAHLGLTSIDYESRRYDFFCCIGDVYTVHLYTFFRELTRSAITADSTMKLIDGDPVAQRRLVDYLPHEEIERVSEEALQGLGYERGSVSLDDICLWQSKEAGLTIRKNVARVGSDAAREILGKISFSPLEITIFDDSSFDASRQRFTLAHELGHHFLGHSRYMSGEYCEEIDFETNAEVTSHEALALHDVARMEWQANHFASCLLLPRSVLVPDFLALAESYDLEDRGHGMLFVDEQRCNQDNYYAVTGSLMSKYNVSRTAVKLRLERLGLLNDARRQSSTLIGGSPWQLSRFGKGDH